MSGTTSWRDAAMAAHYASTSADDIVQAANRAAAALVMLAKDRPDSLRAVAAHELLAASLMLRAAHGALQALGAEGGAA